MGPSARPVEWLIAEGLTPYPDAVRFMEQRVADIIDGRARELVWLVEHPSIYTSGTSTNPDDLRQPQFPVFETGRGGQYTYHGPGQRVAYAMLDLSRPHGGVAARDVRAYVHALEEWMIRALWRFHIRGERREGRVGIWVARDGREAKIGAIGVRVTRWVAWHGIALNVEPDLSHFGGIVPCGVAEHGVTSLHALGVPATMEEVDGALMGAWAEIFATA